MRDADLIAVVAPDRAGVARAAAELDATMPNARLIGFVEREDLGDDQRADAGRVSHVYDLRAMRDRPLSAVVQLVLEQAAVLSRLVISTAEMEQLVLSATRTRGELQEIAQLLRTHVCGVVMGLHSLRWSSAALPPADQALLDSIRVSVESILVIADRLGTDRGG